MIVTKDGWILPFKMNQVCFDSSTKEMVQISNGTCTLDHSSPLGFAADHKGRGCSYEPSEALAYRVVGVAATKKGKDPVIAFTYRKVDPKNLSVATEVDALAFLEIREVRRSRILGRV